MKKNALYAVCFIVLSCLTMLLFNKGYDESSTQERMVIKNKLFESLALVDGTHNKEVIEVANYLRKTAYLSIPSKSFLRSGFGVHAVEKIPDVPVPTAFVPTIKGDESFSKSWRKVCEENSIAFQNYTPGMNVIVFKQYTNLSRVVIAGVLLHETRHAMIQIAAQEKGIEQFKAHVQEKEAYELQGKFFALVGGLKYERLIEDEAEKIKLYHNRNNAFPEFSSRPKELSEIFGNISQEDQEILEVSLFVSSVFRYFLKNFPKELETRKLNFFEDAVGQGFFADKE
jgi:hypothetical protein